MKKFTLAFFSILLSGAIGFSQSLVISLPKRGLPSNTYTLGITATKTHFLKTQKIRCFLKQNSVQVEFSDIEILNDTVVTGKVSIPPNSSGTFKTVLIADEDTFELAEGFRIKGLINIKSVSPSIFINDGYYWTTVTAEKSYFTEFYNVQCEFTNGDMGLNYSKITAESDTTLKMLLYTINAKPGKYGLDIRDNEETEYFFKDSIEIIKDPDSLERKLVNFSQSEFFAGTEASFTIGFQNSKVKDFQDCSVMLAQTSESTMIAKNIQVLNDTTIKVSFKILNFASGSFNLVIQLQGRPVIVRFGACTVIEKPEKSYIVSVSPSEGKQGEKWHFTISTINTHFTEGDARIYVDFTNSNGFIPTGITIINDSTIKGFAYLPDTVTGIYNLKISSKIDGQFEKTNAFSLLQNLAPAKLLDIYPDTVSSGTFDLKIQMVNSDFNVMQDSISIQLINGKNKYSATEKTVINNNEIIAKFKTPPSDSGECYVRVETAKIVHANKNIPVSLRIGNVGIKEYSEESTTIFPNPTYSFLNIDIHYPGSNYKAEIYNAIGALVSQTSSYTSPHFIETIQLPTGIYYLKILFKDGKSFNKKFEVRH